MLRAEPVLRRNLIDALESAENAKTQKDEMFALGEAFAYTDSLNTLSRVEGYVPVGGIAKATGTYDPIDTRIARVVKYVGEYDARKLLGLDEAEVEV